jgi:hypothetical protein
MLQVILGVHGHGLSHALWMKPGSAMIEVSVAWLFVQSFPLTLQIMYPGGFAKVGDLVVLL